jgi:hypothetical protein
MGDSSRGKKRSFSTRLKQRNNQLGENNSNYKDGVNCNKPSRITTGGIKGINHKVVMIEEIESAMTYDLEVPETSWFFANNVLVHNCAYCVVWRIEKDRWVNTKWKETLDMSRPNIMFMDNNLSAVAKDLDHLKDVINFTIEHKKGVSFQSGFDCKYITPEMAVELAKVKYVNNGMRLAFDRIEEDGIFQDAVKMLTDAGVSASGAMLAYVLFNFTDRPKEADYRARECANLKVRPYISLYRPLNSLQKADVWVGKHWTRRLGRAFRNFWLDFFLYKNTTFDEYVHTKECIEKFRLRPADILMWDSNGGEPLKKVTTIKKLVLKRKVS